MPKGWERPDIKISQGTFAFKEQPFFLPVLANVLLFKGSFATVLSGFKKETLKDTPIAFLHVDCDIYESTKEGLKTLGDNIKIGTIHCI